MPIPDLTPDKLIRTAADLGLLISGHEANTYARILAPWVSAYKALDASLEECAERSADMLANTLPFNLTHHPAMNVPCGMSDSLPIGMMLVGRCHAEPTLYRVAYAFEQAQDWKAA